MKLTKHQRNLVVTVVFNWDGMIHKETLLLSEVGFEYTESFQRRLLEADGDAVPYKSTYANQPFSGSITGHADDYDQFTPEAESELDLIWNEAGAVCFTEDDWGY